MGFIPYNRKQKDLIGYSLDDFVSQNSKCRYIVKLIDRLDLTPLAKHYSSQGADSFDPAVMLAIWFFSYSEGENSTRKIEQKCHRDMHYIYVSANLRPDHTSLSRFRQKHLDLMSNYFVQLVRIAQAEGISDFAEISTDGSKIQAASSRKQSKTSDSLNDKINTIRKDIDAYMARCDLAERYDLPENDITAIRDKINQLKAKERQLKEYSEQLDERKKELKAEHRQKHSINIIEPDAPIMNKVNGDKNRPAYNAQISVDVKANFIVANNTVQDRNDKKQFPLQYEMINTNLGFCPHRKHNVDSGYFALDQLEYVYKNKIDAVINDPAPTFRSNGSELPDIKNLLEQNRKITRGDFRYNVENNYYECPNGKKLLFVRHKKEKKACYDLYQCNDCITCPLVEKCLEKRNSSRCRNIRRDKREIYAELMNDRITGDDAKERLKRRAMTVEPVFGNLKENLGFRRFCLRGLKNVKGEFNLMCIGHNINILFKFAQGKNSLAIKMIKSFENQLFDYFKLFNLFIFVDFRTVRNI